MFPRQCISLKKWWKLFNEAFVFLWWISANSHTSILCTFFSLLSSHCTIQHRQKNKEQQAARMWHHLFPCSSVAAAQPAGCYFSGCASHPCVSVGPEAALLWRLVSSKLIHVQEWEGQGHRHTPASCCLLFPASAGVAPSPNMTGGWSSQGNNVMGQFSRKAVNSIHKLGPSDWKGMWLRKGGEGPLWCYLLFFFFFFNRLFTDISCCSTEIFTFISAYIFKSRLWLNTL